MKDENFDDNNSNNVWKILIVFLLKVILKILTRLISLNLTKLFKYDNNFIDTIDNRKITISWC